MESGHKFMLNDILRRKRKSKTRKQECPVFLTYGPAHDSPLGWIKRWKEESLPHYGQRKMRCRQTKHFITGSHSYYGIVKNVMARIR